MEAAERIPGGLCLKELGEHCFSDSITGELLEVCCHKKNERRWLDRCDRQGQEEEDDQ